MRARIEELEINSKNKNWGITQGNNDFKKG